MNMNRCQLENLSTTSQRIVPLQGLPLHRRLKLMFIRRLGLQGKRAIKKHTLRATRLAKQILRRPTEAPVAAANGASFKAGDLVRVRSKESIQATLSIWGELKGCSIMREMLPYCGTTQQVLKPVERFLDERDCQVRKVKGIVLLEGAVCEGTALFGRCDRACYFFWRQEWLEKVETSG
ncbi:MAG TPA: hypothetical protein VMT24_04910 [Aggregatilineaceae bacterium]|nr:hypothetical protein [Aggregatilineaceae bacterium]